MTKTRNLPYWLEGGTETCELCTVVHVLEMQMRCVACDRGCCERCVVIVRATREVFCSECHEAGAAGDQPDDAAEPGAASGSDGDQGGA